MVTTPQSLLDRLQKHQDPQAWQRLLSVYEPWLRSWLSRHQLQPADIDDLVQNILAVVNQKLPDFVHNGLPGAFRSWLRTILVNQVRSFLRTRRHRQALMSASLPDELEQLGDPRSDASRQWDLEHDQQLVRRLLASVQSDFSPRIWEIFRLLVLDNLPAAEVARRLGIERNAVYVAKARVLARLRQELQGLIDE
jgi:RNA polymerase sigma-70 factor (ECF subfamily)